MPCSAAYEAGLKIVLRHRFITLLAMFGTIALTGYLYVVIPKGFFPQQDTGLIIGLSEAAQDISYSGDGRAPAGAAQCHHEGSGRRLDRLGDRRRRRQHHDQQRPHLHCAQALQAARPAWKRCSRGCGPTSPRSRASRSICRPRRTSPSAAGSRKPSISTRWTTPIPAS